MPKMAYTWEIAHNENLCLIELTHSQETQKIRLFVDGNEVLKDVLLSPNVWKGASAHLKWGHSLVGYTQFGYNRCAVQFARRGG